MSKHFSRLSHNWLVHELNRSIVLRHRNVFRSEVYDLGCGEMPYKDIIEPLCEKYVGVDWSGSQHRSRFQIEADLNRNLPIESHTADTVVSFQAMEHLRKPQLFLREAFRILKPGGHILITVPFQWGVHEAPHDYFRYTRYGLEYLFKQAGFDGINITANTGFWSTFVLKFNYQSVRWIRGPSLLRYLTKGVLVIAWFVSQKMAPMLDRVDRNERETASYTVLAKRPLSA